MPSYDPSDKGQVEDRKRTLKAARRREIEDLRSVLATPAGRRVFWRLLGNAGLYRMSFNTNALSMAFAEGSRNQGIFLLTEILEADKDAYVTMQLEANAKKTKEDATDE